MTFTYPLIGNYGVNDEDWESAALRAQGDGVPRGVRDAEQLALDAADSRTCSRRAACPGICGIDTRALTRHLRERGVMRGCLSAIELDADVLVEKARRSPSMLGLALADLVTCVEPYWWTRRRARARREPADDARPAARRR